mmetsp:Transcript_21831/g.45695  ORF Transcript_21831/g.45695 Transcript_21831/m.45695 type:complete len:297 (-) Transcript_21831:158-1048(-)
MGGADHDTPAPVGRPGLDMDKKSAFAGAGGGAAFASAAAEAVDASDCSTADVVASPPHEGAGAIDDAGVASAGGGGGADGVPIRNEKPLVPLPIPTWESTAVAFASSAAAESVSPFWLPVNRFPASPCSAATPSISDMKPNEDPAAEEGAASVDGGAATAAVGVAGAGDARKENPLDAAETARGAAAAAAASFADETDPDEDAVNPANMDGAEGGGAAVSSAATAIPGPAADAATPPMEAERNPNAEDTVLGAADDDDDSPAGDVALTLAQVVSGADGAGGDVSSEGALGPPPMDD